MKNLAGMMKQAQELQGKMAQMQEDMLNMEVTGSSGAGMCEVTLNGQGTAKKLKIDPSLVTPEDVGVMEDLILAAFNDARAKIDATKQEQMADLTGGLPLPPGFKLPF